MPNIFLSYSRKDIGFAEYLAAELRNRGANVFIDYKEIVGGENFIARIGREIENCDYFLIVLSPNAVLSKWVKAEMGWAVHSNKRIIPLILEATTLRDFFFLAHVHQIDFGRWKTDGHVDEPLSEVILSIGLEQASSGIEVVPIPVLGDEGKNVNDENPLIPEQIPEISRKDASELLIKAAELAATDAEKAIFLYKRLLDFDSNYLDGQAAKFIEREEKRLLPKRIESFRQQATQALSMGSWKQVEQLADDILLLDPQDSDAKSKKAFALKNAAGEGLYDHAKTAISTGQVKAAVRIMEQLHSTFPEYGDPMGVLKIGNKSAEHMTLIAEFGGAQPEGIGIVNFFNNGHWLLLHNDAPSLQIWDWKQSNLVLEIPLEDSRKLLFVETLFDNSPSVKQYISIFSRRLEGSSHQIQTSLLKIPSPDKGIVQLEAKECDFSLEKAEYHGITVTPSGGTLICFSGYSPLRYDVIFWNCRKQRQVGQLEFENEIGCIACSTSVLAIGSMTKQHHTDISTVHNRNRSVVAIDIFVASNDKIIDSLDHEDKDFKWDYYRIGTPIRGTTCLAVSQCGDWLAIGNLKGEIALMRTIEIFNQTTKPKNKGFWDRFFETNEPPFEPTANVLNEHSEAIVSIEFSPDSLILVSASLDKSLKIWSVNEGTCLRTIEPDGSAVKSVRITPDGKTIASALASGKVMLFGLNTT